MKIPGQKYKEYPLKGHLVFYNMSYYCPIKTGLTKSEKAKSTECVKSHYTVECIVSKNLKIGQLWEGILSSILAINQ